MRRSDKPERIEDAEAPAPIGTDAEFEAQDTAPPATARTVRRFLHSRAARQGWWVTKAIYTSAERFLMDDGLYMASALAFSVLLAIFPFLIFVTALTGFIGGEDLASWLTNALFDTLPDQVAQALEPEVYNVLIRDAGSGLLTFSIAVVLISVSSAVETVRGGLNRAYGLAEPRSVIRTRIESIVFVILATAALVMVAFAAVVAPVGYAAIVAYFPDVEELHPNFELLRQSALTLVLAVLLFSIHLLLPAHKSPRPALWPGIVTTMALWWIGGRAFSWYLASFADYARIYAGLAGIVAAMIFFYLASTILLYAGALNRALHEERMRQRIVRHAWRRR